MGDGYNIPERINAQDALGQALRRLLSDVFDTSSGHAHSGTDSKKITPTDLDGVTASAAEINKLDGASANVTATNLNGLVGGGDIARAAGGHGHVLAAGASDVTASAAELNVLDNVSAGVARASSGVVLGTTKNLDTLLFNVATPGAAGGTQGTATALTAETNLVTAANGAKGVKLPVAVAGRRVVVANTVGNAGLLVYPASGAAINAAAENGAVTLPGGCQAEFCALSATQWYVDAACLAGVRKVVALSAHQLTLGAADTNYRVECDFSASGSFGDVCFVPTAVADGLDVIVQEDAGQKGTGKFALILFARAGGSVGTYGDLLDVELTVSMAGYGWTGATTGPFAGTWSEPQGL